MFCFAVGRVDVMLSVTVLLCWQRFVVSDCSCSPVLHVQYWDCFIPGCSGGWPVLTLSPILSAVSVCYRTLL